MKKFFSEKNYKESSDNLFQRFIDLIDRKYILDRELVIKDIFLREKLISRSKHKENTIFGNIHLHASKTNGINELCLSVLPCENGHIEILLLWNEMNEHILGKFSELIKFLEKVRNQNFSFEQIIDNLKKI